MTPGRISTRGISPLVAPQDTAGPMARTVADVTVLLRAMMGLTATDPVSSIVNRRRASPIRRRRSLGHPPSAAGRPGVTFHRLIPCRRRIRGLRSIRRCSRAPRSIRATVSPTLVANLSDRLKSTSLYLNRSRSDLDPFLASRTEFDVNSLAEIYDRGEFSSCTRPLRSFIALSSSDTSSIDQGHLSAARDSLRSDILRVMHLHRVTALCFPTVQTTPPSHAEVLSRKWSSFEYPTNTTLASHTGLPALSVPIGFTTNGFPVGIELVGRPYARRALLEIGSQIERVFGARTAPG